jgi:hypothetical protein
MGSNYKLKLQKREAEARKTPTPAPAKVPASTSARVEQSPVRAWVNPETLREARGERPQPARSSQYQAYHRRPDRPLYIGGIVAVANRELDEMDTSMFSSGPPVDDPRPPGTIGR